MYLRQRVQALLPQCSRWDLLSHGGWLRHAVFQVISSSPSALIRIQRSADSSPSSSTHEPGAQRTSTFSAAKAARAQALSSSHGVWSLSRYRLFHLPTALGSQVTGISPALHL